MHKVSFLKTPKYYFKILILIDMYNGNYNSCTDTTQSYLSTPIDVTVPKWQPLHLVLEGPSRDLAE